MDQQLQQQLMNMSPEQQAELLAMIQQQQQQAPPPQQQGGGIIDSILSGVQGAIPSIPSGGDVARGAPHLAGKIRDAASGAGDFMSGILSGAGDMVPSARDIGSVIGRVRELPGAIGGALSNMGSEVSGGIQDEAMLAEMDALLNKQQQARLSPDEVERLKVLAQQYGGITGQYE